MFITKFSVRASMTFFAMLTYIGANPLPSEVSSPSDGQLLTTRGLTPVLIGGSSDGPLQKRGSHIRRAITDQMTKDIETIKTDMPRETRMLTDLEKTTFAKLTKDQSTALNGGIEAIIAVHQKMNDLCQKIADAFPKNADTTKAMGTIKEQGRNFGYALAQSKRPVGGSSKDLPANLKIVRGFLPPITDGELPTIASYLTAQPKPWEVG
ncbi:hypothetical protein MJO28_011849 [Puccinia striiformis f. sp. tritici]|uniref:Uncharacterized protein n=1 Tax=Puccinia striiformis f. sp. tritici TaxID=168172 RepID=A0ACC0E3U8_9BASI|nr:hypothetical protein MJO28_011849 [Puccinia striiformis f. sp. tritici]